MSTEFRLESGEILRLTNKGFAARIKTNHGNAREFTHQFTPDELADIPTAVKNAILAEGGGLVKTCEESYQYPTGRTFESKLDIVSTVGKTTLDRVDLGLDTIVTPVRDVYVPVYWGAWKQELIDEWDRLINTVKTSPELQFICAINPASGPGTSRNATLASKVQELKDAGAKVLGYVGVNYFSELTKREYPVGNPWPSDTPKTMADLKIEIDRYLSWYPVEGFMFDDYPNNKTITMPDSSTKDVYTLAQELNRYARSKAGITYIKANAGTVPHVDYFALNDNISVFEGSSVPTQSQLDARTRTGTYKAKSSTTLHSMATLPSQAQIDFLYQNVDYIYITDSTYNSLPTYWDSLIAGIKAVA